MTAADSNLMTQSTIYLNAIASEYHVNLGAQPPRWDVLCFLLLPLLLFCCSTPVVLPRPAAYGLQQHTLDDNAAVHMGHCGSPLDQMVFVAAFC